MTQSKENVPDPISEAPQGGLGLGQDGMFHYVLPHPREVTKYVVELVEGRTLSDNELT